MTSYPNARDFTDLRGEVDELTAEIAFLRRAIFTFGCISVILTLTLTMLILVS